MPTNYEIKEFFVETGEEIVRPATKDEIKQLEAVYAEEAARKAEEAAKAEARAALLERLGITAEEAKLLA